MWGWKKLHKMPLLQISSICVTICFNVIFGLESLPAQTCIDCPTYQFDIWTNLIWSFHKYFRATVCGNDDNGDNDLNRMIQGVKKAVLLNFTEFKNCLWHPYISNAERLDVTYPSILNFAASIWASILIFSPSRFLNGKKAVDSYNHV